MWKILTENKGRDLQLTKNHIFFPKEHKWYRKWSRASGDATLHWSADSQWGLHGKERIYFSPIWTSKRHIIWSCKAGQNKNITTNYTKARIDKTQQKSKCRLCSDRDEKINHIISECSKLAPKKYKTTHDWMEKLIHWELCKKVKFGNTNKRYMHKPESVPENELQTPLEFWDTNGSLDLNQTTRSYNNLQKSNKLLALLSWLTTELNWKNCKEK